ncbi:MAG: hypothetical protein LBS64_01135 [Spirochaetaceae bacterium]|jgi:hypothetical protein|nr:hypothetical protein [Spirochaetaceae bacterium]
MEPVKKNSGLDARNSLPTNLIVLSQSERLLVDRLVQVLTESSSALLAGTLSRLADMQSLADSIARFPSLLNPTVVLGDPRNPVTIINRLILRHQGDKTLYMPSKATLGKSFLVTKYHTFELLRQVAEKAGMPEEDMREFQNITAMLLFTLMVEDVYLTLLDSEKIAHVERLQIATALIFSWEHRSDLIANDTALALQSVWHARTQIVPVFGTMGCKAEFVVFSQTMDTDWIRFVRSRLDEHFPDHDDVELAVEEFLMGISYEQIRELRQILIGKKIPAISREEAYRLMGETAHADSDLNDFYMGYTIRRDNAAVRKRLNLPGPQNTLEYHYMAFTLSQVVERHHLDMTRYDEYFLTQFSALGQ